MICNFSGSNPLSYVELHHDFYGSFSKVADEYLKGISGGSGNVLLFHFNNDSFIGENETYTYDWSGNGNAGNASGATYTENGGKWFGGYSFGGGSDEFILVKDSDSLDITTNGTIALWFKLNNKDQQAILTKGWEDDWIYNPYTINFNVMAMERLWVFLASSDDVQTINANVGTINTGQWYHFAVAWNGSRVITYLNGVQKADVAQGIIPYNSNYDLKIGSGEMGNMNGAVDEVAIYNRAMNSSEIFAHFNENFTARYNTTLSLSITNMSDGSYFWNCLGYDNETSNWSLTNYTFHVDVGTPPDVHAINLSPSSIDDVDPGVNVSVTANVTDMSNVSAVILQYKAPLAGGYTNDTMDFNPSTGLWENGTVVTTPSDIGDWSYRIWSNDTNGISANSSVSTLSVQWDKTWDLVAINSSGNVSDSLGMVSGMKESVQTLGMLIINNTGDYSMNFNLILTVYTVSVSYNVTEPFDLPSGNEKHIEVNATMPFMPNEYPLGINITAVGASPLYRIVNSTVISFIGGPYINETTDITEYPISIKQGSSANLTASVSNIGNDTAYDVWLNWTLPSGWSLAYGNLTNMIGNLSPQDSGSVTVTAQTSSSATAGASIIRVNSSSNGTAGGDFKMLSVSCNANDGTCGSGCSYSTDDDCEEPSSGGGTAYVGIGTVIINEPKMGVSMPERVDLTKGEPYNFSIEVSNPVSGTNLTNIVMRITGYPETLLRASPSMISHIPPNQSGIFVLEIDVPPYIEEKDFLTRVDVSGTGTYSGGKRYLESTNKIIFAVHGVMESETLDAIRSAELAIEKMRESNFTFIRLLDMLEDAKQAYADLNFDAAKEIAQSVVELQESASRIFSLIGQFETDVEEAEKYGVGVDEAKKMQELAISAFQRGDFQRAENRITAAITTYRFETKTLLPIMKYLYENWPYILLFIVLFSVFSMFARKRIRIRSLEMGLEKLGDDKKAILELVKRAEDEYFNKGKISKLDYSYSKDNFKRRLAELGAEELKLVTKRALLKGRGKRDSLASEKESIERKLKEAQHRYFELGKMSKGEFNATMHELQAELADIEKNLDGLGKPKRSKGMLGFLLVLAFMAVFMNVSAAQLTENVTAPDAVIAMEQAFTVIDEMEGLGFGTDRVNHTLENARLMFSRGEYEIALTTARYVSVLKQKALIVDVLIDDTELKVHELTSKGFDVSIARGLFLAGVQEFEVENYEDAEVLLSQAMDLLDEMESASALSRAATWDPLFAIVRAIHENWVVISGSVVLLIIISVPVSMKIRGIRWARRIARLELEMESLKNSMKKAQEDYFHKKGLSKKDYETRMEKYKRGLSKVMETLASEKEGKC